MYAGGVVSVVSTVWSVQDAHGLDSGLVGGAGVVGGAITLGLWIWMALANRAGLNWARITATVFFGIASADTVIAVVVFAFFENVEFHAAGTDSTGQDAVSLALSVVEWLIGLYATVMMWNKSAGPFYRPPLQYGPVGWGVPGIAPYGYPVPASGTAPGTAQGSYPYPYPAPYPPGYPYPAPAEYPYPYQPGPGQPEGSQAAQDPGAANQSADQPADPWQTPEG